MRIWVSAKAEYGVRAASELARAGGGLVKARTIAASQDIPLRFLMTVLRELVVAGLVESHRGADGGFRLSRPPAEVSVGDVLRAVAEPMRTSPAPGPSAFDDIVDRVRSDAWRSLDAVPLADLAPRAALVDVPG
jgi:Rrf2 family protein